MKLSTRASSSVFLASSTGTSPAAFSGLTVCTASGGVSTSVSSGVSNLRRHACLQSRYCLNLELLAGSIKCVTYIVHLGGRAKSGA